jgi:hypothetical protein
VYSSTRSAPTARANGHGRGQRVHEQADPHAQRAALGINGRRRSASAGKLQPWSLVNWPFAVGHKGRLVRAHLTHKVHQVVKRIAFDVVFAAGPVLQQVGKVEHVLRADVALVRARVHGDAVRTGLQALGGRAGEAGNAQVARVAHQGDFVQVDRQGCFHGGQAGEVAAPHIYRFWRSIIIWRVRSVVTPQW